ncbi:MAG TPA: ankyrin repeat domain-containing protein [Chlamydiales bacterium]|nr:ankyrin repeat domain-containing protein [Chlamydiales bacterium]
MCALPLISVPQGNKRHLEPLEEAASPIPKKKGKVGGDLLSLPAELFHAHIFPFLETGKGGAGWAKFASPTIARFSCVSKEAQKLSRISFPHLMEPFRGLLIRSPKVVRTRELLDTEGLVRTPACLSQVETELRTLWNTEEIHASLSGTTPDTEILFRFIMRFLEIGGGNSLTNVIRRGVDLNLIPKILSVLSSDSGRQRVVEMIAERGNLEAIRFLHRQRPELFKLSFRDGLNFARLAATYGRIDILDWIEATPDLAPLLQSTNERGWNIAHEAAEQRQLNVLKWIAARKTLAPLLRGITDGCNIAHIATDAGHLEVLDWIRESSALRDLLTAKTGRGETIAHIAADCGDTDILDWIVDYRDLLGALLIAKTEDGKNMAHMAARSGRTTVFDWILNRQPEGLGLDSLLEATTLRGENIAHLAAEYGETRVLDWIVTESRVSLDALLMEKTRDGGTIVHVAAKAGRTEVLDWIVTDWDSAQRLLDEAFFTATAPTGENAAHFAVIFGKLDVLKWIARVPALAPLLQATTRNRMNIAHFAARHGHIDILEWIAATPELAHLLRAVTNSGANIAHWAVKLGRVDALQWIADTPDLAHLLQETTTRDKSNIAHWAAGFGALDVLKWIAKTPNLAYLLEASTGNNGNIVTLAKSKRQDKVLAWIEMMKLCLSL